MTRCANCHEPLRAEDADPGATKRGRKTHYCNDACKQRAYRQRKERELRNEVLKRQHARTCSDACRKALSRRGA